MSVLVAQELKRMRREINEHEDPVRPQHPGRLGDGRSRPVGVMQYLVDDHGIEGSVRQSQLVHIAKSDGPVFEPNPLEIDARDGQHLTRLVDTECSLDLGC